jgi:hypothetical protein
MKGRRNEIEKEIHISRAHIHHRDGIDHMGRPVLGQQPNRRNGRRLFQTGNPAIDRRIHMFCDFHGDINRRQQMATFKLTRKYQFSKRCKDGRSRNFLLYFLNGVQILKQKIPYNEDYEKGFDRHTAIYEEFLLNGRLHQTRTADVHCGMKKTGKTRHVSFPVSRKILNQLQVPNDLKIGISSPNFDDELENEISAAIANEQPLFTTNTGSYYGD